MIRGLYSGAADDYVFFSHQEGGRMCGLHALNNLFQCQRVTREQLDHIAERLTAQENSLGLKGEGNSDTDGYYSISVLEVALQENNVSMASLGSTSMGSLRNDPTSTKTGYLCHSNNHYFVIRPVKGRWFLIDSLQAAPRAIADSELKSKVGGLMSTYMLYALAYNDDYNAPLPDPSHIANTNIPYAKSISQVCSICFMHFDVAGQIVQGAKVDYSNPPISRPVDWGTGATLGGSTRANQKTSSTTPDRLFTDVPELDIEPSPDEAGSVNIRITAAKNSRITRRFSASSQIKEISKWLMREITYGTLKLQLEPSNKNFVIMSRFPTRMYKFEYQDNTYLVSDGDTDITSRPISTILTSDESFIVDAC